MNFKYKYLKLILFEKVLNNVKFWKQIRKISPTSIFKKAQKTEKPKVVFPSLNSLKKEFREYAKIEVGKSVSE